LCGIEINIHSHSDYYQLHWLNTHFFLHHSSTTSNTPSLHAATNHGLLDPEDKEITTLSNA